MGAAVTDIAAQLKADVDQLVAAVTETPAKVDGSPQYVAAVESFGGARVDAVLAVFCAAYSSGVVAGQQAAAQTSASTAPAPTPVTDTPPAPDEAPAPAAAVDEPAAEVRELAAVEPLGDPIAVAPQLAEVEQL